MMKADEATKKIAAENLIQIRMGISFEKILENVNEAICVIDEHGVVTYWNNRSEKLYGVDRMEIVGADIAQFFPNALCLDVLRNGNPVEYVEHRPREGNVVIISCIPIRDGDHVIGVVSIDHDVTEIQRMSFELQEAKNRIKYLERAEEVIKQIHGNCGFERIVYKSKQMYDLIMIAKKVAESDVSVMIVGESGTGKDLFAYAIHEESMRRDQPFVVVDCSAIPSSLIESELFGYESGAFTGAQKKGKPGKFEIADGGTVFLDEIGELPLEMQSKLLRVLESHEFYRVGGVKPIKVDIRVIAATNREMATMLKNGTFRQDLFYRLNVFSLKLPALRERPEDIPILIDYYLKKHSVVNHKLIDKIAPEVMAMLLHYHWPGNVRELKNVVERLVVLADDNMITAQYLPLVIKNSNQKQGDNKITANFETLIRLEEAIIEAERRTIINVLTLTGNNKAKAAKMLRIPRSTLYYKLQKLNIVYDANSY
ncbi:Transcriptional regulatory protein ZraR [Pelotomaculum schinkii]|uniref:Transcriptional regulatory protein ZraR n=2 Tax=Pelotomaculum TaxID=191373 RepID=A0A4Y7RAR5_9FIRM|nr:sigma 54-interacting transcriptional regulator [Pelotomaculum schinkii]TEB06078.1 Transcriptional regulatory protein ZraR [Pelotomaculum schinkii]